MKKIIVIILVVLVIGIIVVLVQLPKKGQKGNMPTPTLSVALSLSPTPIIALSPLPKITADPSKKITVGDVSMIDFYQAPEEITADGNVLIESSDAYTIEYQPKNSMFHISITASPFEPSRQKAEQELLHVLGITQAAACKLNVETATPFFANAYESGNSYQLSFCKS